MSRRFNDRLSLGLILASFILLVFAVFEPHPGSDTEREARRIGRKVERRLDLLEKYAMRPDDKLPDDMVIYRYVADTLQSWRNQFPVMNDNIENTVVMQRIVNPMVDLRSPLAEMPDSLSFCNLGTKWYLARAISDGNTRTVMGLEILNPAVGRIYNASNRSLHIGNRFTIKPMDSSCGSTVYVRGNPVFKVLCENFTASSSTSAFLVWLALGFFLSAAILYVLSGRTLKRALISAAGISVSMALMFFWGLLSRTDVLIFSPTLYAGGWFLYSLGAVLIVNLTILLLVSCLYIVRRKLLLEIRSGVSIATMAVLTTVCIILILFYTHLSLRSITLDSGITLELYKFESISLFTVLVYASYLTMLMSIPMLLQMLQPALSRLTGRHFRIFSRSGRLLYSAVVSLYLVSVCAMTGFEKEEHRVGLWAGRLSVDRDVSLELQLLRAGQQISSDVIVSTLSMMGNPEPAIRNRIVDSYLSNIAQDYNVNVRVIRDSQMTREEADLLDLRASAGESISEASPFVWFRTPDGLVTYSGMFLFYNERDGIVRLLLDVERKTGAGERGYASLLNLSQPGRMQLPAGYSYARYRGRDLISFGGDYSYQTRMDDQTFNRVYSERPCHEVHDSYVHFETFTGDNEVVLVSRPQAGPTDFLVAAAFLALVMFLLSAFFRINASPFRMFDSGYYRTRINWVLMLSLLLTLVSMAGVSVLFVYKRNEASLKSLMTDKINSVQSLVLGGIRDYRGHPTQQQLSSILEMVAQSTKTDVSLYSPDGRIMLSTTPEVFDRMLLGCRLNENAFEGIVRQNRRFFIQKEHIGRTSYYCMYAPLMGPDNRISGILCSPYTDRSYDFERDAVMHAMVVLTLFMVLLLLARFMSAAVVDRMFKPLSEMGRKMVSGGLGSLEYIRYDREDEISSLVRAYNRMVTELTESSVKLAQAERDKAWSGMARQVAHEIKNPLTPMKLQIQRLIRLKSKGDDSWQDKFDDVSRVLLDHIDILTQTANEFSTFAKLYTEEPTRIDLDRMIQEEISMFDGRDGVTFEYIGMKEVFVMGPKPQLTRVIVNLINNSVQALEDVSDGVVRVSLRNSVRDGYYDIVFEDNGPGVAEENECKLFVPNFTTKSSGSGLGLAISRSILEKCEAEIAYSRSFSLGGACFTVTYPK